MHPHRTIIAALSIIGLTVLNLTLITTGATNVALWVPLQAVLAALAIVLAIKAVSTTRR